MERQQLEQYLKHISRISVSSSTTLFFYLVRIEPLSLLLTPTSQPNQNPNLQKEIKKIPHKVQSFAKKNQKKPAKRFQKVCYLLLDALFF
jgi:hypothetical protein